MSLLVRPHAPDDDGTLLDITPASAGWKYVGFRVVRLAAGARYNHVEDGREACLVVLTGTVSVDAGGERFEGIGGRATVFDGAASSVYVPAGHRYTIEAGSDAEIAICTAPGTGAGAVRLIRSEAVEVRGKGTNTRHVRNILSDADEAESLLVVEVITPGGHWSSYPPHKHDRDAFPEETFLEETYYHRLSPPQGFAFQRVYTDERDIDETMAVEDGDVVMVPRGYHPVGAPHGYDLYYLNVMAGPRRNWVFRNDPAHDWIVRQ
ncbi:5-deoxy-glucuronate isomerase [Sphingopyxis macrogoltabida]|uniref:5-deoxy-glucuronate isomerase n=1 Tax=Sphingopyxis macrogoltabida TaxID=33050 RepID=A0AAC9FFA2_SPHMC|nr:5-deoxy-glucuronate isomerase [Sphingopyxis macrogoltabida]ALJ13693.1 5-deoxyglucuronate isomerase [Sphingopyxis macrogoltabida]AMU88863.1 5-deoxy-glucuronate isomerase [Sphingopyxis macrogoltabida]